MAPDVFMMLLPYHFKGDMSNIFPLQSFSPLKLWDSTIEKYIIERVEYVQQFWFFY